MKLATNGSAGAGDELGGRAALQDPAVHDHADPVGERGGILEVVRDEDRRQRELAEQLVQLDPHRRLGVGVERRERLVQQQDAGSRASARASATRWRSPPESSRDARRGEVGDPEPLEQLVDRRPRRAPKRTLASTSRWGNSAYSWNR